MLTAATELRSRGRASKEGRRRAGRGEEAIKVGAAAGAVQVCVQRKEGRLLRGHGTGMPGVPLLRAGRQTLVDVSRP